MKVGNKLSFRMFIVFVFASSVLLCVEPKSELIITKFVANKQNQEVMVEIYNTSNKSLKLENVVVSGVKSTNMLPYDIRNNGGCDIAPHGKVLLCVSAENKNNNIDKYDKIIMINGLKRVLDGGYIAVNNMINGFLVENTILLGKNIYNVEIIKEFGEKNIVDINFDEVSVSRKVNSNYTVSNWK